MVTVIEASFEEEDIEGEESEVEFVQSSSSISLTLFGLIRCFVPCGLKDKLYNIYMCVKRRAYHTAVLKPHFYLPLPLLCF